MSGTPPPPPLGPPGSVGRRHGAGRVRDGAGRRAGGPGAGPRRGPRAGAVFPGQALGSAAHGAPAPLTAALPRRRSAATPWAHLPREGKPVPTPGLPSQPAFTLSVCVARVGPTRPCLRRRDAPGASWSDAPNA